MRRRLIAVLLSAAMLSAAAGDALAVCAAEDSLLTEEADLSGEYIPEGSITASEYEAGAEEIDGTEILSVPDDFISEDSNNGTGIDGEWSLQVPDDFIAGIEEVETKNYAAGEDYPEPEEFVAYDEVTETLEESGLASVASRPNVSLFRIRAAVAGYTDSYGAQLSGNAKLLYDAMVQACLGVCEPQDTKVMLSPAITCQLDNYSKDGWDKDSDAGYQEGLSQVRYEVQSAYGAFMYDYPQVFWMSSLSYGMSGTISGSSTAGYSETFSSVTLHLPSSQLYQGAAAETPALNSAVQASFAEIRADLGANASCKDTVKAIHDYLCKKIVYQENVYAHSAVGVFLKGGNGVCECYAKSFAILCRKFDIPVALIVGDAGDAHMWNYVQVDGGNWYLVDVTWDDQTSGIRYEYFLAGGQTVGFKAKPICEERTVYTSFSESAVSRNFVVPVLSDLSYEKATAAGSHTHSWTMIEEEEGSCIEQGYRIFQCEICDDKTQVNFSAPHKYKYVPNDDATCQKDGTKTQVCIVCGEKGATVQDTGSRKNHLFTDYKPNGDATCSKNATETALCAYGCGTKNTREIAGSTLPHTFAYVANDDATCQKDGTKTQVCSVCGAKGKTVQDTENRKKNHIFATYRSNCAYGCGATDTVVDAGTKLSPTIAANATELILQKGQSTSAFQVSVAKGDYVKSIESLNKKLVKVTESGKIKAKKNGSAKLLVTLGSGTTMTVKVKVQSGTIKTKKILNVPRKLTLKRGTSMKLSPELKPITSQQKISYSSSNKKVVSVSASGKLKARGKGTATITVKSGSKKVKCKVKVK